jgi:ABC-type nickel/cobalt efflux system permease component RcnA
MFLEASPTTLSTLALGLVVGIRHAVEADHVAAVSTIVSQRNGWLASSWIGGLWGVGHSAAVLAIGAVVLLTQVRVPVGLERGLELGVGVMLVGLGIAALYGYRARRGTPAASHRHTHGWRAGGRGALLVGLVHGLAGSGALTALVLSSVSSTQLGLLYILLFGIGSTAAMIAMSALISLPARYAAGRFERAGDKVHAIAGALTLLIGVFLIYELATAAASG